MSLLPDLKELGSMTGKLFNDIKNSVNEIITDYKQKRTVITPETAAAEPKTQPESKPEIKSEVKPEAAPAEKAAKPAKPKVEIAPEVQDSTPTAPVEAPQENTDVVENKSEEPEKKD